MSGLSGIFGGTPSGRSQAEIEAEAAEKRRQDLASTRARAVSRLSRRGTASLTLSPTSTGLNIPGTGGG